MTNPFESLLPIVNATTKKDIQAIDDLMGVFPGKSLAEIVKSVRALQEAAQGGVDQVVQRLSRKVAGESDESLPNIKKAVAKLSLPELKEVYREFGFDAVGGKRQLVADLGSWLETGGEQKPLSKKERLAAVVDPYLQRAKPLMARVDSESATTLLRIVEEAYADKQLGKDGLQQFAAGLEITTTGTKGKIRTQLRDTINRLSVSHVQSNF